MKGSGYEIKTAREDGMIEASLWVQEHEVERSAVTVTYDAEMGSIVIDEGEGEQLPREVFMKFFNTALKEFKRYEREQRTLEVEGLFE